MRSGITRASTTTRTTRWARQFREGFEQVLERGENERVAIMCAESVWWRCHRRIVTDYLLAAGRDVWHIMGPEAIEPARMTAAAKPGPAALHRLSLYALAELTAWHVTIHES